MRSETKKPTLERLAGARDAEGLSDVLPLLERLIASYNRNVVAQLIGVDRAQVTRWTSGQAPISAEMSARILGLHSVIVRAHQVFTPQNVPGWLFGHSGFLGGARPIDALAVSGPGTVLEALDAYEDGIYS